MRFSYILPALSALAAFVSAQSGGPNSFMIPMPNGYQLTAGQPTTFTWENLSGSTVTLTLRDGPSGNLNAGTVIASKIQNTGSFTFTPPANTVAGTTYTIQITNDQNPSEVNFTPQFPISSTVTATPSSASTAASTASGSTMSMSSASMSSGSMTTVTMTGSTTMTGSMTTQTGSTTMTGSSTTGSSSKITTTTTASPSSTTKNAAVRRSVGAGAGLLAVAAGMVAVL